MAASFEKRVLVKKLKLVRWVADETSKAKLSSVSVEIPLLSHFANFLADSSLLEPASAAVTSRARIFTSRRLTE